MASLLRPVVSFLRLSTVSGPPLKWQCHCIRLLSSQKKWSYASGVSTEPMLGYTVGQLLERAAERFPNREAVVVVQQNIRVSYSQLLQDADKLAAGLLQLGLKAGDRIGIWGPNCYEWVLTQLAAGRAGLVLVNINPAYQPRELAYCLKKVGINTIVASESFKTQDYYKLLCSVVPAVAQSRPGDIISEDLPKFKSLIMISENRFPGAFRFQDVMELASTSDIKLLAELQSKIQFDDAVNIQFTSGTTGSPKGATLSHHNIVNNGYFIGREVGYHEEAHRICVSVPLYHCFGCIIAVITAICHGACCVFPAPSFQRDPCLSAIHKEKCTSIYGTPTMFVDMLNSTLLPQTDFSHVKTGIMAGAVCPEVLVKRVINDMNAKRFVVLYGSTESSPAVTMHDRDDGVPLKARTVGKAMPHTEVKVVDSSTGKLVPINTPGEVCSRGYTTMLGYWEDDDKTRKAITSAHWYHSGDLATMDENGYINIIGRIKDMVIRGGENIYPKEIEEYLISHPNVADAQVVGVPDERMGEELCAWVLLKTGTKVTEKELRDFCKGNIAHFKIPRYICFVDKFPTTVTGKIQKFKIREEMERKLKGASSA